MKRKILALALLSTLATTGGAEAAERFKVALSTAMTGPVVQYGDMHRAGVHLAVERINAAGGVLGRQMEIIEMDDACNPGKTEQIAKDIAASDIRFVLGPLCSGAVPLAAKVYNDNNILMIAATASSDELSEAGQRMFFRTIGRDGQQGTAAAEYIVKRLAPKKLAIIHENQAYGQGLATQVKTVVTAKGIRPVIMESFEKGGKDFTALISKMQREGVDVVYYGGYHPELIVMLQQAQAQRFQARWIGPGGIASPAVKGDWAEGLLVTLPPDYSLEAANADIAAAFRAKQQDPSGSFVMTAYASAQVLAEAVNKAGTDDPVKVAATLHNGKFSTVMGETDFSPQGDNASARFSVFTWHKDASKTPAP